MDTPATLADYWTALYSRKWVILTVAVSSALFAVGISRTLPPVYEAKASFFVPANYEPASYTGPSQQRLAQAQVPLKPIPDEKEAGIVVGVLKSNDLAVRMHEQFPQRELSFFKKNVDFSTSPQFFTDIYVRDGDPKVAAAIANGYVDAYRRFHIDMLSSTSRRTAQVLESQVKEMEKKLVAKAAELSAFQRENNLYSESESELRYLNQTRDIEQQLSEVAIELQTLRSRMAARGESVSPAQLADESVITANPRLEALRKLEIREAALKERLARLTGTSRATTGKLNTLKTLEVEKDTLRERLTALETNLAEARMQSEFPNVQIVQVQTAEPPTMPGFPIVGLNAVAAFLIGLAAGCYYALLLEYIRRLKIDRTRRKLDVGPLTEAPSILEAA